MPPETPSNFLRTLIESDLASGRQREVVTRFPPEPNGYLHIGHSKAICVNFGLAAEFGGRCHLRYDDTNPEKEELEYIEAIQADVRWLGFDWGEHLYYGSDFFEDMYLLAEGLILDGKAYVDSQSEDEIRATRGTVTEPGLPSPYRERTVEENLDLFRRMRAGEFPDGAHVLRAKIDMAADNMKMRDPLLYRIRHAPHPHVGDAWVIYPFYDYAHPLEDALEGVTHSFCTLEFENNREIYDWVLDEVRRDWDPRPRQTEFARLKLTHTMMSKRKLLLVVKEGHATGWDDPRMPTIAGLRRRGVTPAAIREFSERVGVAKANSTVDHALLESCVRDDLNHEAPRRMVVLEPLALTIENYPEDAEDRFDIPEWPPDVGKEGEREVPFSRVVYVEREDFAEVPPKGFYRLAPGREVRLRGAWLVTCTGVEKNDAGEVIGLRGTYDPDSRGGNAPDGRKVRGTLHWVSAHHAADVRVHLYDHLFAAEEPGRDHDFHEDLNPASLHVVTAKAEPALATAEAGRHFQFERQGYFFVDPVDSRPDVPVFNRVVSLKDSWTAKEKPAPAPEPTSEPKPEPTHPSVPAERPPRTPEQQARFGLYTRERGIAEDDADLIARDDVLAAVLTEALAVHDNAQGIANWLVNDLQRELKEHSFDDLPVGGTQIGELVALLDADRISSKIAKDVFAVMLTSGGHPEAIVRANNWEQVSDRSHLTALVDEILAQFPDRVAAYRDGRTGLLGFFTGQVMRRTAGKGNPVLVQEILKSRLGG